MIGDTIKHGLLRKASTKCSIWTTLYRFMENPPGPWSFKYHPWTREMHDFQGPGGVAMKGAQLAVTETALNKVFHKLDIEHVDCLYLLPAMKPDASDFSLSRFEPAIELSPHLNKLFSEVRNVGHKRAGTVNLYIRGAKSKKNLKSIPVGFTVFDELDEMDQRNIPLAMERMSGQLKPTQYFMLSTPTIPDFGIHARFLEGTQEEFFFPCPHCSRQIRFTYPDSLVITADDYRDPRILDSHLICTECKHEIQNETKWEALGQGKWVPSIAEKRLIRSWHISQLYSSSVGATPAHIAKAALKAKESMADEVELYNSKLGMTHIPKGGQVTDEMFMQCIGSYNKLSVIPGTGRPRTAGVDVGKLIHVEIDEWIIGEGSSGEDIHERAICKMLTEFSTDSLESLDQIFKEYGVRQCIIDANPDTRAALKFAQRYPGLTKLCYYTLPKGRSLNHRDDFSISVNRTQWMDTALFRFHQGRIILPKDTSDEYKRHLKVPIRTVAKDHDGNPIARWICNGDDHLAHARTYSEIALQVLINGGINKTIYTMGR